MDTLLTSGRRILTNAAVWSPDGEWIVYDTRSDAAGDKFDSTRIEMVHVRTRETRTLYESQNGAHCGVASWHPKDMRVAFILGPEHPTADYGYGPSRRQGVIVDADKPGRISNIDARDLVSPFTPGALRGGSHVHMVHPTGDWLSFTYDDDLVNGGRNVAVCVPAGIVKTSRGHPRNHDGSYFTVLATRTVLQPKPGSDEISKAFEEAWLGSRRAFAFQGHVVTAAGATISEVFVAELPDDVRIAGDGPLQGTATALPYRPKGTSQKRLTFTAGRKHPGLQGPRHWLRSAPDGSRIGCLMKDDAGIVQLFTVTLEGKVTQLTRAEKGIGSAFTWSSDGSFLAAIVDDRIARIDAKTGTATPLSAVSTNEDTIRPEACVISPDGKQIAYMRRKNDQNHICITSAR